MQTVKNQLLLAHAFVRALALAPRLRDRLRLAMVGDGPLRQQCTEVVDAAGLGSLAWLPGERADIPAVMRGFHLFVLPSLAEGISNTILEAMATGLAVIASDVGGNSELVVPGVTGHVVPAADVEVLAAQLVACADNPEPVYRFGQLGRQRAVDSFSMQSMVNRYLSVYDAVLGRTMSETSNCIA
jgi:glycosyltransferase involved in cell wall biosynthesis